MSMKPSSQPDQPKPGVDVDALMGEIRAELEQGRAPPKGSVDASGPAGAPPSTPALSTGEIMERVRAEVARRRAGNASSDGPESEAAQAAVTARPYPLPRWQPLAPRLPDQPQYVLADFLRFDDADFVETAYRALLRRPADPEGLKGYLDALRSGAVSKVEILGLIRFSEEGRRQAVHVDGLLLPYKLHHWRHVRIFGWVLGMGMAVARLPRLAWRLQGMEASAARETRELGTSLNRLDDALQERFAEVDRTLEKFRGELVQLVMSRVEGLRSVNSRVVALQAAVESTGSAFRASDAERISQHAELQETLAAHDVRQAELAASLRANDAARARDREETANRLIVHDAALARLDEQARSDHRALRAVLDRLTVFLDASARRTRQAAGENDKGPSLEEQYASFEHTFRGESEQIKQRASHYLGTLATAGIMPGDEGVVLDLGSGRGEWLEVLAEHGYHGRGVDANRGMLKSSRDLGHDVVEADAIEYLRAQDANSVAAITSMHMVEHMPHPVVIQLLDEALRVLRPGGVLILETPNPENVLVGSCMFYMDPTHLHPIPPPLLQWTVQARGFEHPVIERLTSHRGSPDLRPVPGDVPGAEQINQMIAWFTAAPDYAVVARKPA
jgi:O-antigen chain-terminating methyltransferase